MSDLPAIPATPQPLPDSPPPVARWRWWLHLLLIAAYPLGIGLLSLGQFGETRAALASTTAGLLVASGFALVSFVFFFGPAWLASRASGDELRLRWHRGFWPVPWGIGYSLALRFGLGLVAAATAATLVGLHIVTPDEFQTFVASNSPDVGAIVDIDALREDPAYFWLMITFVSFVVAGLREELWRAAFLAGMRALGPRWFSSGAGQLPAAAIAAVIFGFGHAAQGPLAAVMAGLLGFGLGAIMIFHRSIWPAVLAHGFFDATSFALIPFATEMLHQFQQSLPP